jgi:two-component system, LuxR family, sensor kinase FixL
MVSDTIPFGTLFRLAASIVHEVNQPLVAIVINGDACLRWLARDDPNVEEARASVAAMIEEAARASEIVRGLCTLASKGDALKTRLNLNWIIEQAIPLIENELRRNAVLLQLNLTPEPLLVFGNRVQLQQVIINLVSNAIQAMAPIDDRPRKLRIRSRRSSNHARVTVQDNGTGLDPHCRDHLFNAFYTTKTDGLGIGLSICRSIIEAHGGQISARSNSEHGAAFSFALPVAQEASSASVVVAEANR